MFGTTQIAANAIANNLDGMGVLPGQAMNLAMITVVGRCVGQVILTRPDIMQRNDENYLHSQRTLLHSRYIDYAAFSQPIWTVKRSIGTGSRTGADS